MYNLLYNTYLNMNDSIFNYENQLSIQKYGNIAYIDYKEFLSLSSALRLKAGSALKALLNIEGETIQSLDFELWYEGLANEL